MHILTRRIRSLFHSFTVQEKTAIIHETTKLEGYVQIIYKILSWENYSLTLSVFLVLNFLFWLVIQCQMRFVCAIFIVLTFWFMIDSYLELQNFWKQQIYNAEIIDELYNNFMRFIMFMKTIRKDSPSFFSIGMCFIFILLSFIARNIPGAILFYLLLLAVFFVPLGISQLPPACSANFRQFVQAIGSENGMLAEDELIPYIKDKDFEDRDPELDSLLSDKTQDSITNSLISGLNSMPSYLDADDAGTIIEEDDLLPQKVKGGVQITPEDLSTDSDTDNREINFSPTHFNGDTSSEDEHFAGNMNFPSIDAVDQTNEQQHSQPALNVVGNVISNIYNAGGVLVTNAIKAAAINTVHKESSSDSEFEIINSDDLK